MHGKVNIEFEVSSFEPVEVDSGSALVDSLDATNSPILFGCRTGICGTCCVRVLNVQNCRPQTNTEKEFFESVGLEEQTDLRLSCQLVATDSLILEKVKI